MPSHVRWRVPVGTAPARASAGPLWGCLYLFPSVLLSSPAWLYARWKRPEFRIGSLDGLLYVVPGWVWVACVTWDGSGKDTGNLIEPILLSCGPAVATYARLFLPPRLSQAWGAANWLLLLVLCAVASYLLIPPIHE